MNLPGLDWKHMVAFGVGIALSFAANKFGIDFSGSCPPPPKISVVK